MKADVNYFQNNIKEIKIKPITNGYLLEYRRYMAWYEVYLPDFKAVCEYLEREVFIDEN